MIIRNIISPFGNFIRLILVPNLLKLNIIVHMKRLKIFLLSLLLVKILTAYPLIPNNNEDYSEERINDKFSLI